MSASSHGELRVQSSQGETSIRIDDAAMGMTLTQILRRHGLPLNTRCAGQGLCNGCRVHLVSGELRRADTGHPITLHGHDRTVRACVHHPGRGETVLHVPDASLATYQPQVVDDFELKIPFAHDPLWQGTPKPHGGPPLAAAIDIGTTTVAVLLINLEDGRVLARASSFNRQIHYGDDVLTRINLCFSDATLVDRLQEAIVNETISPLIDDALRQAGAQRSQLVCITAAGNMTMLHLLAGVDPSPMGVAPFTPAFLEHRELPLTSLDFRWPDHGNVHCNGDTGPVVHLLPGAAAYVGADLTAGAVACGLAYASGTHLLVDVGTNGEIILHHNGQLLGCATAAGPAFEGSGLADGVRAGLGAISHVRIATDPLRIDVDTIGDIKPIGICGSAYIDLLAEGVRTGLLNPAGRFDLDAFPDAPMVETGHQCRGQMLCLARGQGNAVVCVSESDIAALLQAKAAIAAGILTLLDRTGLTPSDVDVLHLAGGFGMHVSAQSAITCGLLPGFRLEQIHVVGNTSLAGAYLAALDRTLLKEIARVGRTITPVELNLEPSFENHYIDQLSLM